MDTVLIIIGWILVGLLVVQLICTISPVLKPLTDYIKYQWQMRPLRINEDGRY